MEPALDVIYVAFGYRHVVMALNSARSLRAAGSECRVKLITNLPLRTVVFEGVEPFDEIVVLSLKNADNRQPKTNLFDFATAQSNLFLDCDTTLHYPVHRILPVVRRFDIAVRELPFSGSSEYRLAHETGACAFNTGVLFFEKNDATAELFRRWDHHYRSMKIGNDQPSFFQAVVDARPRILPLGATWNATPEKRLDRNFLKQYPAKVLHYRNPIFWPSVGLDLARIHEHSSWEWLDQPNAVRREMDAYGALTREYKRLLFRFKPGRWILGLRRPLRPKGARWDRQHPSAA